MTLGVFKYSPEDPSVEGKTIRIAAASTINATINPTFKPSSLIHNNTLTPSLSYEKLQATTNSTTTSSISTYVVFITFLIFIVWRIMRRTKLSNIARTEDASYMRVPQAEGDIENGKLNRSIPQAGDDDTEHDNIDGSSWEEWDGPSPGTNDKASASTTSNRFPLSSPSNLNSNGPAHTPTRAQQSISTRGSFNNISKSRQSSPGRPSLQTASADFLSTAQSAPAPIIYTALDSNTVPIQTTLSTYSSLSSAPVLVPTMKKSQPAPPHRDSDDLFASIGIAAKPKFVPPTAKVDPATKHAYAASASKKPTATSCSSGSLEAGATMSRVQSLGGGSTTKASPKWDDADLVDELLDD